MSRDSKLCIKPPEERDIWKNPKKFWTRDPGNCDFACQLSGSCPHGIDFINAKKLKQKEFKNKVLSNLIISQKGNPAGGKLVYSQLSKKEKYSQICRYPKIAGLGSKTFATQNFNNKFTNPNTQNLNIIRINNNPSILIC